MGVDDDRIRLADPVERRAGLGPRLRARAKYPPYAASTWMRKPYRSRRPGLRQRIHRPGGRGAEGHHDRTHPARARVRQSGRVHPPAASTGTAGRGARTPGSREWV